VFYYLAPYELRDIGGMSGYAAPAGVVGSVDLRTLGQQSGAGGGAGFFAAASPLAGLTAIASGDLRELNTNAAMRSAWRSATGVTVQGDKLIDLLWDHLTEGADPNGDAACCPLMPTRSLDLELHLGGHSLIKVAKLDKASRHWNKVQAVERRHVESLYKAADRGEVSTDLIRTNHDHLGRKYGIDKPEDSFTPPGRGKLPRKLARTIITESFPSDGAITSGQDQSWSNIQNTLVVSSGRVTNGSFDSCVSRMNYDFASDHYAQHIYISGVGANDALQAVTRKDSSATITNYQAGYVSSSGQWATVKVVAGTGTVIGTNTTTGITANDVTKLDANGSTQSRYKNGSLQNAATDTAITGNTRTGIRIFSFAASPLLDSFEAGDAAAGGGIFTGRAFGKGRIFGGSALV
jgi:hypothetical protein